MNELLIQVSVIWQNMTSNPTSVNLEAKLILNYGHRTLLCQDHQT